MASAADSTSSRKLLADLATSILRDELLNGDLAAGARVNVAETAQRLEMSTIPVREALRALATEGLLVALPLRGFRVAEATLADLEDTYRLRLTLDPMAVGLAVPLMSETDLDLAAAALEKLREALEADDHSAFRATNRAFHFIIYDATGSPWLVKLISLIWENTERYHRFGSDRLGTPAERFAEHAVILEACRERDAERAATLMHEHLAHTFEVAREVLIESDGG